MKKCASCTKDLPDAALHCVFCGAKQPPAPATSGGVAKTVMGYSAQELIEQMKQQQAASRQTPPASSNPYPAPRATNVPGGSDATVMGQASGVGTGSVPLQPNQFGNPNRPMPPSGPIGGPPGGPIGSPIGGPMTPGLAPSSNASGGQPPMDRGYAPMNAGGGGPVPTAGNVAPTMFAQPAPSFPQQSGPMGGPMGHGGPMGGPMGHGGPMGGPMGPGPGPIAPNAAPTVMVNVNPPPAAPQHGSAAKTVMAPAPIQPMPAPMPAPQPPPMGQPVAQPVPPHISDPPSAPAFLPSQTAARVGRPIEPWKDSLRTQMFIWGGALLVAFLVPMSIDPFRGNWDAIIDGEGTAKLPPLIVAAVGLLSVALAAIPTSPSPRALMAALLGLTGILVPVFLPGMPPWQTLANVGGMALLLPGLLMRSAYRDAILPRILVTLGALAVLSPLLVPVNDTIPVVGAFKGILDAEGKEKIIAIIPVLFCLVVVLTLLAWLPSPSSGMSSVLVWVLLLWQLVPLLVFLMLEPGQIGDLVTKQTGFLLSWIDGLNGLGAAAAQEGGKEAGLFTALFGAGIVTGFGVLITYGTATIVGKKLE